MPDDLTTKEAARWIRYAKEDYNAALLLKKAVTPRHACLLAQQGLTYRPNRMERVAVPF